MSIGIVRTVMVGLITCLVVAGVAWAQSPQPQAPAITLLGTLSRPVGQGQVELLKAFDVHLVDFAERRRTTVRTNASGEFRFHGIRPGALYYVVAVSHLRFEDATPRLRAIPAGGTTVIWMPDTSVRVVDWAVSWHQAITEEKAGTYRIELSPWTADPEFCDSLDPTFDGLRSEPYRSWRRALLQPVPSDARR